MAFFHTSVESVVTQVAAGTISAMSLVEKSLSRIAEQNPTINAITTVCAEQARRRAEYVDSLSEKEKQALPLCGIPVAVKDNICTKDVPTTCSSRMLAEYIPPYNAHVVERLEAAGAIVVGKASMDEFAMGSSNETSFFGPVKNPRNTDVVPGGSSGGSAAAVAADMVPLALGSDTGGSIRQPASHCGVVGLKPTYGRVSRYGLVAFASSFDQIGPLAQRVEDASLLLSVIAGEDRRDSTNAARAYKHERPETRGDFSNVTVGVPKEYFSHEVSSEVAARIETVIETLRHGGARITEVSLPNVSHAIAAYYVLATAEASSNLARFDGVKYGFRADESGDLARMYCATRREGFGEEVRRRILLGTYVLSSGYYDAYYLQAAKVRTLIKQDFSRAFETCDLLLSPVTPSPAFPVGEKISDPLEMYLTDIFTVSANLAGIPGIAIPAGTAGELPVGAQLMAADWDEKMLLSVGAALHDPKA
ncbi:Asp-tRNA(Asn)/Glu-tRNA(Gln) amidotransferase subunit GatA [Chitinivibrio alkaliphilus]|uniref:Glutamyl-tRNA(Gln) amidotransferase subunit A n=1 Tax=Chitinivibrio alkaliphilus ACht1 TaxID=1313304 RepID=U7D9M7_9BACT|nr:Asp-tRNA(Asn)/Glu-tRNA(Gln) amidotransferase subunit GatA [Chitinivibrio alkaliphilus]ERP31792.1 glutamyl-tRNA(gln) amidotransferase subunit A [Chitinivibrio alkaliphilus ACht1]